MLRASAGEASGFAAGVAYLREECGPQVHRHSSHNEVADLAKPRNSLAIRVSFNQRSATFGVSTLLSLITLFRRAGLAAKLSSSDRFTQDCQIVHIERHAMRKIERRDRPLN